MTDRYDIVIVGAGPAGATLALTLAALPLRIAVLEANPLLQHSATAQDSKALALTYGSMRILDRIGIWPTLAPHATTIAAVHVSDRGHFGFTRINAEDEKVPALGAVIPAAILAATLQQTLRSTPQLTLINPARVQTIAHTKQDWQLELETDTGKQVIAAELIIAADGTNSTIRQLLHLATEKKDYLQNALTTTITLSRSHQNRAYERFIANGALAMLPLAHLQCGSVWTGPSANIHSLMALSDEAFLAELQKMFGYRLGRFVQVGKRHSHPLSMLYTKEAVQPGLVLIGNAAQTLHPIAAQGFNLGLSDVAILHKIIAGAVTKKQPLNKAELFTPYLQNKQQTIEWSLKFTDNLTRFFSHDFLPLTLARNSSLLALDLIPPLKHRLAKRLMGVSPK